MDDKDMGKITGGRFKVRITCDDGVTRDVEFEIVDFELE